jgi:hypothetical protein
LENVSAACATCGFSTISPADGVVALRSFPRRFREELDPTDEGVNATVVAAAGIAAAAIDSAGRDLARALGASSPGGLVGGDGFERLDFACAWVSDLAAAHHGDEWSAAGAVDALATAVHAGVHELRSISS